MLKCQQLNTKTKIYLYNGKNEHIPKSNNFDINSALAENDFFSRCFTHKNSQIKKNIDFDEADTREIMFNKADKQHSKTPTTEGEYI